MGEASLGMLSGSKTSTRAKTTLAPQALQGLEVLSLPVTALPHYLTSVAESNPLLELNYDDALFSFSDMPSEDAYEDAMAAAEQNQAAPPPQRLIAAM